MKNVFAEKDLFETPKPETAGSPPPDDVAVDPVTERSRRPGVWVFVVTLLIGLVITGVLEQQRARSLARQTRERVERVAESLQLQLHRAAGSVYPLGALVHQARGDVRDFDRLARPLMAVHPGVFHLALEPGGVTTAGHPANAGLVAPGRNLFQDPATRDEAVAIMRGRNVRLLTRTNAAGERVLVSRLPVYFRGANNAPRFWGFVSASIHLDELLKRAGLDALAPEHRFVLLTPESSEGSADLVAGDRSMDPTSAVSARVSLANVYWQLAAEPAGGWYSAGRIAAGVLISLALAGLVTYGWLANGRLRRKDDELRGAEEGAVRSGERFDALLEAAPDALIISNARGEIVQANARAVRLFGYRDRELIGKPVEILVPQEDRDEHARLQTRYHNAPTIRPSGLAKELWGVRKDGRRLPVEITLEPLEDDDGGKLVCAAVRDVSKRHELEALVRRGEHGWRVAFETTNDAWLVLEAGRVVDANPAALTLFQCPDVDAVVGRALQDFAPATQPDGGSSEALFQIQLANAEEDGGARFDCVVEAAGEEMSVEATLLPLDDDDSAARWLVALRDPRASKRSDCEDERRHCLQTAILDAIPHPMFVKDADARFVGCNRAYEEAFNTTSEYIKGRTVLELEYLKEDQRQAFQREDVRIIEAASRMSYELKLNYADGEEHEVMYSADGFRLPDGSPGGLIGLLVDVTDRKRADRETRRDRRLLQDLIDNANAFIYVKDTAGRYLLANRRYAEMLGMPIESILGRTSSEVFPHAQAADYEASDREVLATGGPVTHGQMVEMDGGTRYFLSQKFPLRDEQGNLFGTGGVSTDVSEIKLAQDDLAAARDAADSANRAKSAFLAAMSHEIRTPMNAILNLTGLALDTPLDPRQKQYLSTVQTSARGLLALINDILDFSKIEAGRMELEHSPFELRRLLEELTESFRDRVLEKHLEFVVSCAPTAPDRLVGDPLRLRQVLVNLVGNAFKFTETGEINVRVEVESETLPDDAGDGGRAVLRFEVRDTGVGIPLEAQPGLFRSFTQADSSTARKYGGSGLGLAICQRLVGLMGGSLSVESAPDEGSAFAFTATFDVTAGADHRVVPPADLAQTRVLVVEDNASSRDWFAAMLRAFGLPFEVVATTADADAFLAGSRFDLLIVDALLPGENGVEFVRRLRGSSANDVPPVIMVSCFAGPDEERDALAAGVDLFVPKPLTASQLFDALMTVLRPAPAPGGNDEAGEGDRGELGGFKVLLAEDNEANRLVATELLRAAGLEPDVAVNGVEAVVRIRDNRYDLVLMDVQMPEMDGLEATRAIRETLTAAELPVIALTANAMRADLDACLAAGMNDYVTKPIDRKRLLRVMRKWLPSQPRPSEVEAKPDSSEMIEATPDEPVPDTVEESSAPVDATPAESAPSRPGPVPSEPQSPPIKPSRSRRRKSDPAQPELFGGSETAQSPVPGVNLRDAVNRLGLPEASLGGMMLKFARGTRELVRELQTALEAEDWDTARRHAHSIAGSAGNFSAEDLRRFGKSLEMALKFEQGNYSRLFADVKREAEKVCDGIERWREKDAPPAKPATSEQSSRPVAANPSEEDDDDNAVTSAEDLQIALEQLYRSLMNGDMDSVAQAAGALKDLTPPPQLRADFENVQDMVDNLDYGEAARVVEDMLGRLPD